MSGAFSGRDKIAVGIAKETTRGTAATATNWYPWSTLDFKPLNKKVYDNSAFNVLEDSTDGQIIQSWSEGKLGGRIIDQSFGLLLYNIFGGYGVTSHTGETTVKDHTFTENQSNTPQSLTFTRVDNNIDEQYANGMVKSLDIEVAQGKYVMFSADVVASLGATSTDTVAYIQENGFTSKHVTATLATTVAGLPGTVAVVKSLKMTINKDATPWFGVGQNQPFDIYTPKLSISGDMTLRFLDTSYKAMDFNNTPMAMLLDFLNTDVNIGVVPSHPELKLQFNRLVFENWTPDQQLDQIVEQTLSFTGTLDFTTGAGMKAILTNTKATY
jgi:hypothetical protein